MTFQSWRIGHEVFDEVSKLWNEPININLSNHDSNSIEKFEVALNKTELHSDP